jgi:hypothetical protein
MSIQTISGLPGCSSGLKNIKKDKCRHGVDAALPRSLSCGRHALSCVTNKPGCNLIAKIWCKGQLVLEDVALETWTTYAPTWAPLPLCTLVCISCKAFGAPNNLNNTDIQNLVSLMSAPWEWSSEHTLLSNHSTIFPTDHWTFQAWELCYNGSVNVYTLETST